MISKKSSDDSEKIERLFLKERPMICKRSNDYF